MNIPALILLFSIAALLSALVLGVVLLLAVAGRLLVEIVQHLAALIGPWLAPAVRWMFLAFLFCVCGHARSEGAGAAGSVVGTSPPLLLLATEIRGQESEVSIGGADLTDDQPQVLFTDGNADGLQTRPALSAAATLAQLPEATPAQMGTTTIVLFSLLSAASLIVGIIVAFRKNPSPFPVIQGQRFADHETTKETLTEIKDALKEVHQSLEKNGTAQYNARRRMHRKLNHMSNALHYLAGEMFGSGDARGQRLRAMLEKMDSTEEGEGNE